MAPQQLVAQGAPAGAEGMGMGGTPPTPNPLLFCHWAPTGMKSLVLIPPIIDLHMNSIVSIGCDPSTIVVQGLRKT